MLVSAEISEIVESSKVLQWPLCQDKDKRTFPRRDIYMSIQYRLNNDEPYKEGMLVNLSRNGALIFAPDKLELQTSITIVISPDSAASGKPIQVIASIVRAISKTNKSCHSYGCRILNIDDPN